MSRLRSQEGSLPMALIAGIVVAGLVSVLLARAVANERNTRFDRTFTEALHTADAGVNEALFELNAGLGASLALSSSMSGADTIDGIGYSWTAVRDDYREWTVTSRSTAPDGVERVVVATVEERPRFFPGAFGDQIVALNGTSTDIDSYDPTCAATLSSGDECEWGSNTDHYAEPYGTNEGSIGTNGKLDLTGNTSIRPGGAFLYDWADNPGTGITASDPFGTRCDGNPCTTTYVSTIDERLQYDTPERMGFVTAKFDSGGGCADTTSARYAWGRDAKVRSGGNGQSPITLSAYVQDSTWAENDPTSSSFQNYYCAETLEFLSDVRLDKAVTVDRPLVIFVRDLVKISKSNSAIACHHLNTTNSWTWCPKPDSQERDVQPWAGRLQIYVAGQGANDVSFAAGTRFAGIIYAPKSRCGGPGNGGADVYGLMICSSMDNVGNWDFHFDASLGIAGSGEYDVALWQEDTP